MRSHFSWVFLPLLWSCGGGQAAADGPKAADPSPSGAPTSSSASGSSGEPSAGASPSGGTTTVALASSGELQGAKLTETHTVASTAGSAAPAGSGAAHGSDPGRTPADIRAIVIAHRDEARACYDKALPAHPGIEGDLVIQFTIDPKGNVTQVSLDSSRSAISEPSVVACVAAVIQKIQFAPSPKGFETKAFYPFNFRAHQKPAGSP